MNQRDLLRWVAQNAATNARPWWAIWWLTAHFWATADTTPAIRVRWFRITVATLFQSGDGTVLCSYTTRINTGPFGWMSEIREINLADPDYNKQLGRQLRTAAYRALWITCGWFGHWELPG